MKTTKKIAALSLMLLFAVITAYSATIGQVKSPSPNAMIRHQVTIMLLDDKHICGSYVVELRNQFGQLVAPPKIFIPGTLQYLFYERAFDGEAVRTALLRPLTNTDPAQCASPLFAQPVTIKGIFEAGKTYRYDLVPKAQGGKQ
jgi:hypothetical protein